MLSGTVAIDHIELLPPAYLDGIHLVGRYGPLALIHKVVSVAEAAVVVVARHGTRHGRNDVGLWLLAQ